MNEINGSMTKRLNKKELIALIEREFEDNSEMENICLISQIESTREEKERFTNQTIQFAKILKI